MPARPLHGAAAALGLLLCACLLFASVLQAASHAEPVHGSANHDAIAAREK